MDLAPYLATLQDSLAVAARAGGDEVQDAAERLSSALEPALRLTLLEFASELTDDITVRLDGDSVEVRLRGGQPEVVVERRPRNDSRDTAPAPPPPPPSPSPPEEGDSPARVSLRLPETLKSRVDEAAATEGVSVNTWIVRAAQRALQGPTGQQSPTRRMTGWAR